MADIVNLRQLRKQKARAEKEQMASQNRALHGRTKAEKQRDRLIADKSERFVAGHHREKPGEPGNPSQPNDRSQSGDSSQSDGQ
ncbi:DUF4169 family protein [Mesorhizobium sp. B2-3-13]|uniref:DUF4169 family protein n=1 Tax=Mesorhizobium sp. B2-3-13 TaxID=2589951 RepID=UPI001126A73C|nr:DUF4169 family protein [Mesorhizobium sp. B2-3-13]TPL90669.1 DUF4169 family protein [Mesorhizobium sp. B2-3-13]